MTVPGVRAAIVRVHHRPGAAPPLRRLRPAVRGDEPGEGQAVLPLDARRAIERWAVSKGRLLREEETGEPFRVPCCPDCTAQIVDKDGVPLTFADLNRRKHTCAGCDAPLWQADRSGPARYPLADYIKAQDEGLLRPADRRRSSRVQGARLGPGHRRRHPRRRVRQVPQPDRDAPGRVLLDASSTCSTGSAPEPQDGVRALRRAPLDTAVRLRGGHRRQGPDDDAVEDGRNSRRRKLPQGDQGAAGPRSLRAVPHHREHGVPADWRTLPPACRTTRRRSCVSSMDSEEDATGLLPAQRLQHRVRGAEAESWLSRPQVRLQAAAGDLPPDAAGLPGRLHQGARRCSTPGAGDIIVQVPPPVRGEALPEGARRSSTWWPPSGWKGRRVLVYVTHTGTRDITGRMDDILTRHGFRVAVMKADAVAPNKQGEVGRRQGEGGHRRPHLPPQAGADGPRPDRLPDDLSGTKRIIQRLRRPAGVAAVVAHRADPPGEGGVHEPTGTPSRPTR